MGIQHHRFSPYFNSMNWGENILMLWHGAYFWLVACDCNLQNVSQCTIYHLMFAYICSNVSTDLKKTSRGGHSFSHVFPVVNFFCVLGCLQLCSWKCLDNPRRRPALFSFWGGVLVGALGEQCCHQRSFRSNALVTWHSVFHLRAAQAPITAMQKHVVAEVVSDVNIGEVEVFKSLLN